MARILFNFLIFSLHITGWLTIEKTGSGFEGLVNFYTFGASYVNVALSISLAP